MQRGNRHGNVMAIEFKYMCQFATISMARYCLDFGRTIQIDIIAFKIYRYTHFSIVLFVSIRRIVSPRRRAPSSRPSWRTRSPHPYHGVGVWVNVWLDV